MATVSGASLLHPGISTSHTRVVNGSAVFAKEHIWLNGHKVKIGGSLSDTARAINRHSIKTGVRAVVVDAGTSKARLKLITRGNLTINDPKGVLLSLYKGKKIGTSDDMLIQIAPLSKGKVNFSYNNNSIPAKPLDSHMRLSEDNTRTLATKRLPSAQGQPLVEDVEGVEGVGDVVIEENEVAEVPVDPRIRQEYLRQSKLKIAQEMDRSHKEISGAIAKDIVSKVIDSRKLPNTTQEQIELTNRVIAHEIYSSEIGEEFLRRNFEEVLDKISTKVDSNRDKLSSSFKDKLVISEVDIRKSARLVLQEIKFETYTRMADGILKDLGLTIAKSDYIKINDALTRGLFGGLEISFDVAYNYYPKVKERISELVMYCASPDRLSRGELHLTKSRIEGLMDVTSRLRVTDLGLI